MTGFENENSQRKPDCTLTWTLNIPLIIVKQKFITDFEVFTQAAPLWTWSGPLRATWMAVWASVFWAFNASMVSLNSASSDSYNKHSYIEYKHNRWALRKAHLPPTSHMIMINVYCSNGAGRVAHQSWILMVRGLFKSQTLNMHNNICDASKHCSLKYCMALSVFEPTQTLL